MLGANVHVAGRRRFVRNIGNGDGGNMFITDGNLLSMAGSNFTGNLQSVGSVGSGVINSVSTVLVSSCMFDGNTGALIQLFLHCIPLQATPREVDAQCARNLVESCLAPQDRRYPTDNIMSW